MKFNIDPMYTKNSVEPNIIIILDFVCWVVCRVVLVYVAILTIEETLGPEKLDCDFIEILKFAIYYSLFHRFIIQKGYGLSM